MQELTKNNHFKFGYNNKWFNRRNSSKDKWFVKYGRCSREPFSFRKECIETSKLIRNSTGLPINLFLSGGIDSEIIARSFIEADIKINCIICQFKQSYNEHDIKYAFKFCKKFNIPYKVLEIDVVNFWKNELYKNSKETRCVSPQFPILMWLISQIQGYNILGSGECFLIREEDRWYMMEKEKVSTLYQYYILHKIEGAPGFFQYTPEIMLSFLEHPIIKSMVVNEKYHDTTYPFKSKVYKNQWEDLEEREKYHGFEKLEIFDNLYRQRLKQLYPGADSKSRIEYTELINTLAPVIIKEITREKVLEYEEIYKNEKMTILKSPFDSEVDLKFYFAAFIRNEIVGFTGFDVFKDKSKVYQHSALTLEKFRNMGINNLLWDTKMKKINELGNPDIELITINPRWIPGAIIMENKLKRRGFIEESLRPDGAIVLKAKFKEIE